MAYLIPSERAVHDNIHSTAFIASPACLQLIIIPLIPTSPVKADLEFETSTIHHR